ncbi:LuxR C-terminal-related transcriptional regulator [Sinorhizobium meliloti]|nr:LuxR C-terminal-related transcriptional regulator [Sinorhizobium meliloti]
MGPPSTEKSPRSVHFFRQADGFGVGRHGVTIPVRGPKGERSLFTATSSLRETMWRRLRSDCMSDLQVISHYLHDKALTLSGLRDNAGVRGLSPRERQCLEMVAQGKLPKQIAPALQISESAVRLYLRSTKRKLGVATTAHAINRAAVLELIDG